MAVANYITAKSEDSQPAARPLEENQTPSSVGKLVGHKIFDFS